MEREKPNNSSGGKTVLVILLILCCSFLLYYSVMSMLGPSRKLAEIKKEVTAEKPENGQEEDKIYTDSVFLNLEKERAFLQSRIIMAESDSIYLTINFPDSILELEISGVGVHESKMSSFKVSRMLTKGNEYIIYSMLSAPLTISDDFATIPKEPVMIKMAPKDTSEYKPDIIPDTSITEPVCYIFKMTNGVRIHIYQEENEKASDKLAILKFDLNDRLRQTWKAIKSVALLKVPEYYPDIRIRIPRSDAKIIYRAIPKKGQIALFL